MAKTQDDRKRLVSDQQEKHGDHSMCRDRRWRPFECTKCGICCTGIEVPYDPKSTREIAAFFGMTVEQTIEKYYGRIVDGSKAWESDESKRKAIGPAMV